MRERTENVDYAKFLGQTSQFQPFTEYCFFPISFSICFGDQTSRLGAMVLLSTHSICFG